MTSVTSSLAIEGFKDGYGQDKPAGRSINIEGGNGGKEKGAAPADHTTAPEYSACPVVDACCKCRTTSTCKNAQCECRKAARVCAAC